MPQLSPLALHEDTGSARKADGEVGSAGPETMAASPLLWEARGQIQGRVFAGTSCQVWEKTGIQMVILIFHLANWSPHLLSGALCLLAPQSSALKLAGSIVREERPIQAVAQRNLQEKQTQSRARHGDHYKRSCCKPWVCSLHG